MFTKLKKLLKKLFMFLKAIKQCWKVGGITKVEIKQINYGNILASKNILITGGSRGIGLAIAKKFISEGANVIITGRNEKHLKKTVKFIENNSEIEILAIGIGHDVSRYYTKAIKITDVQELGDVMISQLSGLFDNKKKLN